MIYIYEYYLDSIENFQKFPSPFLQIQRLQIILVSSFLQTQQSQRIQFNLLSLFSHVNIYMNITLILSKIFLSFFTNTRRDHYLSIENFQKFPKISLPLFTNTREIHLTSYLFYTCVDNIFPFFTTTTNLTFYHFFHTCIYIYI